MQERLREVELVMERRAGTERLRRQEEAVENEMAPVLMSLEIVRKTGQGSRALRGNTRRPGEERQNSGNGTHGLGGKCLTDTRVSNGMSP